MLLYRVLEKENAHASLTVDHVNAPVDNLPEKITPPRITGVNWSDDTKSGLYKSGDRLKIVVSFSEPVTVEIRNKTPVIFLATGEEGHIFYKLPGKFIGRYASYIGGSNTKNLSFEYVVMQGDSTLEPPHKPYHRSRLRLLNQRNRVIFTEPGTIRGSQSSADVDLILPEEIEFPLCNSKRILVDSSNPIHCG